MDPSSNEFLLLFPHVQCDCLQAATPGVDGGATGFDGRTAGLHVAARLGVEEADQVRQASHGASLRSLPLKRTRQPAAASITKVCMHTLKFLRLGTHATSVYVCACACVCADVQVREKIAAFFDPRLKDGKGDQQNMPIPKV